MKEIVRMIKLAKEFRKLMILSFVFVLLSTALGLVTPWIISNMTKQLNSANGIDMKAIITFALIALGAFFIRAACKGLGFFLSHYSAWHFVPQLTDKVYEKLQKLSMSFYHNRQTGELMSRAVNDARQMEVLFAHTLPDLMSSILITILVTTVLFTINAPLAALTIIPIPLIFFSGKFFMRKMGPITQRSQRILGEINGALQDNISGMKEIQAFSKEEFELEKIRKHDERYRNSMLEWMKYSTFFMPLIEFFTAMGTVMVIGVGGYLAFKGSMSSSDIVGFVLYLTLYYQPIATLARLTEDVQTARAGAKRICEIFDAPEDITDSPDAEVMGECDGSIEFKNVSFHYEEEQPVLKNISFKAEPGKMIALVGPTGVGKTTIISLIERFYDPIEGEICVGGRNIKELTVKSLRENISIILQDVFLFNGTVADNIAYGVENATREEIEKAAEIACAANFIDEMPDRYDTLIGERGAKLSGGQKQRIAIARAVLRDAPILIMDEATAAVDVETEAEIQKAVSTLIGDRTVVVIAHRLSTVKRADKILVLENGKIVESGKHNELVKAGGLYEKLCMIQLQASEDVFNALAQYSGAE